MPFSLMVMAVTVGLAAAASPAMARWLDTRRSVAALPLFGFGFVISATVMSTAEPLDGDASSGVCHVSQVGPAPFEDLTRVSLASLKVLLFIPLGIAVGLLPRPRSTGMAIEAAVSLTFVVEASDCG